jgi:hypothetical protein
MFGLRIFSKLVNKYYYRVINTPFHLVNRTPAARFADLVACGALLLSRMNIKKSAFSPLFFFSEVRMQLLWLISFPSLRRTTCQDYSVLLVNIRPMIFIACESRRNADDVKINQFAFVIYMCQYLCWSFNQLFYDNKLAYCRLKFKFLLATNHKGKTLTFSSRLYFLALCLVFHH